MKEDIYRELVKRATQLEQTRKVLQRSSAQKKYDTLLGSLVDILKQGAALRDAEFSIKLERACILLEKKMFGITSDEVRRYDKQISELSSADNSLLLVSDPAKYKEHIEKNGVSFSFENLPQGEAYISHARKQIQYLAHARKGMVAEVGKDFMLARQDNLRAGIQSFQERQKQALLGHTHEKKELSLDEDIRRLRGNAEELERSQKAMLDIERYNSSLALFVDSKKQEIKYLVAEADRTIQAQEKQLAELDKNKPIFVNREWKKHRETAQKQLEDMRKERSALLKQQTNIEAIATREFRLKNHELAKLRDSHIKQQKKQTVVQKQAVQAQEQKKNNSQGHGKKLKR